MKKQEEQKLAVKQETAIAAPGRIIRGFEAELDQND